MSTPAELVEAAFLATKERRFEEAITQARAAIAFDPKHERARMILANALDHAGRPAEASTVVEALISEGPMRLDLLYFQSVLLRKAGRPKEALPLAKRLVQLQPNSAEPHAHLGIILATLGRLDEAAATFYKALALNPGLQPARYNLSHTLINLGREAEAEVQLREVLKSPPDFPAVHITLGNLLLRRGAIDEAITEARLAVTGLPDSAEPHLLLARGLSLRAARGAGGSDDLESLEHVRAALVLDPNSFAGHEMLGFALQEVGDFEGAFTEFETSLRINPRQGAAYYGLATSRKFTSNDAATNERFAAAAEDKNLNPIDLSHVHYGLAKILEDQRQFEAAITQLDIANKLMFDFWSPQRNFEKSEHEKRTSWVIQTFTREFLEQNRGLGSDSEQPLFVVGKPRSGTTLVEQILSSHPRITGGGELAFWHENAGNAFTPGLKNLDPVKALDIAQSFLAHLDEIGPGAERITDKLPENILYIGLIHALFPSARIVHCRRHPVDTCLSIYATPYTSPADFVYDRGNIVFAFQQYLRLMAHWRAVIPADRLIEVDYEEVVADREAQARRLIAFVGLEWDAECLRHERNQRTVKTSSRWQVRQPIYGTSVARWKNFEPWLGEFAQLLPKID